jgi:hypothetical protein
VSGAGVEVGVMSDSYDVNTTDTASAADGVAGGDLPGPGNPCGRTTPVDVLAEGPSNGTDEGRGMLELVHDLAPGAGLAFASGSVESAFPARVAALRSAGADVVVDDITYYDDPFFQQGPASVAIEEARSAGTAYFSSAGNFNVSVSGQDRSSWEAPAWRSTACPGGLPDGYTGCMNFAAAGATARNQLTIGVLPGRRMTLDFQWAHPWFGVDTDLDIFLLSGTSIVAYSGLANNGPGGTQKPFELMSWLNTGTTQANVKLVIAKYGAGADSGRLKAVLSGNSAGVIDSIAPEDRFGPTIIGHNGAPGAMSVTAVPYSDAGVVESYSSRGPVTHYFGPVNGTTPAAALTQPLTLAKPDIAATDCTLTTFFPASPGGVFRFYGTSAAAPHAAAVAALEREAAPEATVNQIYDAQRATARAVGSFSAEARGAGLVDAYAALDRITQGAPIVTTDPATSVTSSTATLNGGVNPHRLSTSVHFEYAAAGGITVSTPSQPVAAGNAAVQVSAALTGLEPNTTYTYRLVATNSAGTSSGEDRTFTTASSALFADTGAASAVTATGATLAGTADPRGTATSARFEYGSTTAYGSQTDAQDLGSGRTPVDVTATLQGLEPATTYHYRLVATSSGGTTSGADRTFTTASSAPVATTGEASAVTTTGATLAGAANPQGIDGTARFEYGTTTAYGSQTGAQPLGSGHGAVGVTATVGGLEPATTYHYRLIAENAAGVSRGPDRTFTTAAVELPVPPPSAPPAESPPAVPPIGPIAAPVPAPPAPPAPAAPAAAPRTIALTLTGRTLRVTGANDVARAAVSVRQGRRTLARKAPRLRAGAMTLRLRWSDVRNGRVVTVALGGSQIRISLAARRLGLGVGGAFARATLQLRRGSRTLASGALQPPKRALALRIAQARRPRTDRLAVALTSP